MMEQDLRTCPNCGASSPELSPCPHCGWTTEEPDEIRSDDKTSTGEFSSPETPSKAQQSQPDSDFASATEPAADIRDLLEPTDEPEHLLEQVPEDMRGILAARLRAIDEQASPNFDESTASSLREQGFLVSEDARGARLTGSTGQTSDLSASDVVKMAADLEGGVQNRTTLPICPKCEAASPIGDTNCQWCGEPFP